VRKQLETADTREITVVLYRGYVDMRLKSPQTSNTIGCYDSSSSVFKLAAYHLVSHKMAFEWQTACQKLHCDLFNRAILVAFIHGS